MPEALKEGGGGHLQPYNTNDGRFGSNNNGGTSEPTGNGAPAPSEPNENSVDFDDLFGFLDEYESGKTEEQLAEEDKMFDEEEDEIEKIYGKRTENPSMETIVEEGRPRGCNCYNNTLCGFFKMFGYDVEVKSLLENQKIIDYYKKHFPGMHDDVSIDPSIKTGDAYIQPKTKFKVYNGNGEVIKTADEERELCGGFDVIDDGKSGKIKHHPFYEMVFKDYDPSRTTTFGRHNYEEGPDSVTKMQQQLASSFEKIKEGEVYSFFSVYHYSLITRKNGKLYHMDCYHHNLNEMNEKRMKAAAGYICMSLESLKKDPRNIVISHLTRIDDLKPNEETIQYFLDKGNRVW